MEKINPKKYIKTQLISKEKRLIDIRNYIEKNTSLSPESIRYSNNSIIVKAKNSYESIEMRLKISDYLESNNIKIV